MKSVCNSYDTRTHTRPGPQGISCPQRRIASAGVQAAYFTSPVNKRKYLHLIKANLRAQACVHSVLLHCLYQPKTMLSKYLPSFVKQYDSAVVEIR